MEHVRLSKIAQKNVRNSAVEAADEIADAGGSPAAQIKAAREATGNNNLGYVSHQGMRQRQRALARMKAQKEKANEK